MEVHFAVSAGKRGTSVWIFCSSCRSSEQRRECWKGQGICSVGGDHSAGLDLDPGAAAWLGWLPGHRRTAVPFFQKPFNVL